jgi:pyruvate/2-oxoglutarate dehydrogenase complex dihydrolipoamide acyltransferase (E2) component
MASNPMKYSTKKNPRLRTATIDFGRVSQRRHSIIGMIEVDVTEARKNVTKLKKKEKVSFNGWLTKQITDLLAEHKQVAAYVRRKKTLYLFEDVTATVVIEKQKEGIRLPIPLMIEHANKKSVAEISKEIHDGNKKELHKNELIIDQTMSFLMRIYYYLPPFIRRSIWSNLIKRPKLAYGRMGNVVISSVGMMGKVNGWFIQSTLHPVSFGIGSITNKPWVVNNEIKIREILHITIVFDHDVVDGGEMARFVGALAKRLEAG